MIDACTLQELASATGFPRQTLQRRLESLKCPFEARNGSGKGRPANHYIVSKLPSELRDALADYRREKSLQELREGKPVDPSANSVIPLFQPESARAPAKKPVAELIVHARAEIVIPDRSEKVGLAKYRLVTEWRKLMEAQPWGKKDEATKAFMLAYRTGQLLPEAYETLKANGKHDEISEKTLYKLDKRLRDSALENGGNEDYRVLADGRGGWRKHGTTKWRPRDLSPQAQQDLLTSWLQPNRPTVSLAIHAAKILLKKKGIEEDCHEATWRRWLKDFEKKNQHVIVLAREGEKAYWDKCGPYITRNDHLLTVGQVLVADGHDLNFTILHPTTGKPCRMKLIVFFDWASRCPVGWQLMPSENVTAIMAALRMSFVTLGKYCEIVYIDNGKAFKAKVFTDTDPDIEELRGLYARLGIATVFSAPYNARAKIVERFWLTMSEQCERIIPTFCGGSIEDKPAHLMRNEKFHKAWQDAKTQGWVPNVREAAHMIDVYFRWYADQPHEGLGGRKPAEVLESGKGPGIDLSDLDNHFLWRERRTPRKCRVTLFGIDYESDCLHGLGEDVLVTFDTSDLNRVWCYTLEGGYLGEALPVQALHPMARLLGDQVSMDQLKGAISRQRRLARETKKNLIDLGATPEAVESVQNLPWNQKVAVLPGGKTPGSDSVDLNKKDPPAEECRRLELVLSHAVEKLEEEKKSRPKLERPEYFRGEAARYEWCFRVKVQHGEDLSEEDKLFMAYFEETTEFKENYRQRYQDLGELYGTQAR